MNAHVRVRAVEQRNLVHDDFLVHAKVPWNEDLDARAVLTIVLDGHQRVATPGEADRWLGPGEFALCRDFGSLYRRDSGALARTLAFEWAPGTLAAKPSAVVSTGRLSAGELSALSSATESFTSSAYDAQRAVGCVARMTALLRTAGLPFDASMGEREPWDPEAESFASLSRAIDAALSTSGATPMSVDVEEAVGRSRWQVTRRLAKMNEHFGLNGDNWRQVRDRFRLVAGLTLLTHAEATVASVARSLGYGAPHALTHAFSRAGLPSPGRVREMAKALE